MKTIYRIQDKDGRGPFKPNFSQFWVEGREDHQNLVPWIVEFGRVDKKLLIGEHGGCGCENIEQIKRWFSKNEYKKLLSFKYNFVEIEVDRIIAQSDVQLFFGRIKPLNIDIKIIKLY